MRNFRFELDCLYVNCEKILLTYGKVLFKNLIGGLFALLLLIISYRNNCTKRKIAFKMVETIRERK